MSAKRICIIKSRRYPKSAEEVVDGGTLNVHEIVMALRAKNYGMDVFTRHEGGEATIVADDLLTIYQIPFRHSHAANSLERDYQEGVSFVESIIRCPRFDPEGYLSIHTHHWTSGIGLSGYLPSSSKLFHTPHLLALEKAHHNGVVCPPEVSSGERALIERANAVFALSSTEADTLECQYNVRRTKIIVAPNGVGAPFFAVEEPKSSSQRELSLLCIGRICRQKGIDILLDAIECLLRDGIPVKLNVVGGPYGEPDYESIIYKRISSEPLQRVVFSTGQVSHSKVPDILRDCAVYVQPSRYESQGVALLEAMAAGRVVVASDLPAVREYLTHETNGLLCEAGNARELAKALRFIYHNPIYAKSLAGRARLSARAFTWNRMLQKTLGIVTGGTSI